MRQHATPATVVKFVPRVRETLAQLIERHERFLTEYDNAAYAKRYRTLVNRVAVLDQQLQADDRLTQAVALSYFKLLAIKDEWEVARLYTSDAFAQQLQTTFEGDIKLHFHLGAWPCAKKDPATGKIRKTELGPWVMGAFRFMNTLRSLRGTWLDPFRNSAERQLGQQLLGEYERDIEGLLAQPNQLPLEQAIKLAALPQAIRGYGHVREAAVKNAAAQRAELMAPPISQTNQASQAA